MSATHGLVVGQRVVLDAPGVGRRIATVERVADGDAALVLLADETLPQALHGAAASIEFPGRTGLYRATGTLLVPGPRDVRFRLSGDLERIQRREWARAEVVRPVRVEPVGHAGDAVETWTLDLSAGGIRLAGPGGLRVGERIVLRVRLDDMREVTIAATAEIARETSEGHVGVRIEEIDEADRELLVRFVLEQQRQTLRMAGS